MVLDFEDWKTDLLARIDSGLKRGRSIGADALEIYISNFRTLRITMQSGMINATQGGSIGIGCRCLMGNKIGFAAASGVSDASMDFALESALGIAKVVTPDERWVSFDSTPEVANEGPNDAGVAEMSADEAVSHASGIMNEAKAVDPRVVSVDGNVDVNYGAYAVGNTEGVVKASASTAVVGVAYVTAVHEGKAKTGLDFIMDRSIPQFEGIGASGAKKAVALLDAKPLNKTGAMHAVFNNLAAGQLIGTGLANSVNGRSVVEGRSAFADKIGEQVGASFLNVYDDGQIPEDPNMDAIDAEGHPRRTTALIEKGILKTYLFDNYYSRIFETENTGNANRGGNQSFEAMPAVSGTTTCVSPGSKDLDGLLEEVGEGILVTGLLMGMGHSNLVSGDFSIVAPSCYRIEKGEIGAAVEPVTVAGNLYKAFNQISGLSNEQELTFVGKVPSIWFEGFTVSG